MIPKYLHKYSIATNKQEFKNSKKAIGYRTKSAVYILCPFHNEKTPSMRITEKHGCFCYGCGSRVPHARMGQILKDEHIKRKQYVPRLINEESNGQLFFVFDIDIPF